VFALSWLLVAIGCGDDHRPDTTSPSSPPPVHVIEQNVVYGEDDRLDYYAVDDVDLRDLTRGAIVALIRPNRLDLSDPDDVRVVGQTLQQSRNLCSDQRFLDHVVAANCSGTLIDTNLVLTAGHCVTGRTDCRNYRYVFNYYYEAPGTLASIGRDDVYQCDDVVVRRNSGGIDYAIIRLTRDVTPDKVPARVRRGDTPLDLNEPLVVIGFGSGIPAKIDAGGRVINRRANRLDYFQATLDTFGGNSGSGVFNNAGEVVGILVRGAPDYVRRGSCNIVNVLSDSGDDGGEDAVYVARAVSALCSSGEVSARLCGPFESSWCVPCGTNADCESGFVCGEPGATPRTCTMTCGSDAACREDHTCVAAQCRPRAVAACIDGDVWNVSACGSPLDRAQICGSNERCSDGTCVEAPPGDRCAHPVVIPAVTQTINDSLTGYGDDDTGSCSGSGPDRAYQFTLDDGANLVATSPSTQRVLYLRETCEMPETEIDCALGGGGVGPTLSASLDPGTYTLIVDSRSSTAGSFRVDLEFSPRCDDACTAGARRCQGNVAQTCVVGDEGCTVWGDNVSCGAVNVCQSGACVPRPDGDTCAVPTVIEPVTQVISGRLDPAYRATQTASCGGQGPERVFEFSLAETMEMRAHLDGGLPMPTLHLREGCGAPLTEIACQSDTPFFDVVIAMELDAGTYFLFADTRSRDDDVELPYRLELEFSTVAGCEDLCAPGSTRCDADGVAVCSVGPNGCTRFEAPHACGPDERCQSGVCVDATETCVDGCPAFGERQCTSERAYSVCDFDVDGCLQWTEPTTCAGARVCGEGARCQNPPPSDTDAGHPDAGGPETPSPDAGEPDATRPDADDPSHDSDANDSSSDPDSDATGPGPDPDAGGGGAHDPTADTGSDVGDAGLDTEVALAHEEDTGSPSSNSSPDAPRADGSRGGCQFAAAPSGSGWMLMLVSLVALRRCRPSPWQRCA